MHARTVPETGLIDQLFAAHHSVVGIDDETNQFNFGNAGRKLFRRRPLHLQTDRDINLLAAFNRLAQPANTVHPHIDHLAGVVHLHEGGCALWRGGDFRTGHIDRVAGTGRQQRGTGEHSGQRKKSGERLVFHAAHPICFLKQQQLTSAV